jgi:NitT/TauT family transport system ATP-binding protein
LQKLSSALHFELDDLLPLVEAGELLGFLNPEDGALVLTQLGVN